MNSPLPLTDSIRSVADATPVMLWFSGSDARHIYFNKGWLDFRGRTLEQEVGDGWAEGVHPDDRRRCLDTYRTAFDARRSFEMDYRLQRADSVYRWVVDKGSPWMGEGGAFCGYTGTTIDITPHKEAVATAARAEAELRLSEQRSRSVINALSVVVWSYDPATDEHHSTPPWHEYTGMPKEEIRGKNWVKALHPDDQERAAARFLEALASPEPYTDEWRVRRADGQTRHIKMQAVPLKDDVGRVRECTGVCMDVTDRKRSEVLLSAVLDNALDGVIGINDRGIIQSFNLAAERLLGYTETDVIGQNVKLLMPEPYQSEHDTYIGNYLRTGIAGGVSGEQPVLGGRGRVRLPERR